MNNTFKRIGLVGHPRQPEAMETHKILYHYLVKQGYDVILEEGISKKIGFENVHSACLDDIGKKTDLAIVIGGDGNMLRAARVFAYYDIKVIGVNRGNLGFLTDIDPDDLLLQLDDVLKGYYFNDPRFLLEAQILKNDKVLYSAIAVNEIVLHPDTVAHMIDFEVDIDGTAAFSQRADGLIVATPTGSTAYCLSAGGPILEPNLDAIVIVPMFPHSLSARPLVIHRKSIICLRRFEHDQGNIEITCDSQVSLPVQYGNSILFKQSESCRLNLIHTLQYDYFKNLSNKLGWSKRLV